MNPSFKLCATKGCKRPIPPGIRHCDEHRALAAAADNRQRYARRKAHGRNKPHWHRLRKQRLDIAGHACELQVDDLCTRAATTVHLDPTLNGNHHTATIDDLRAACKHCHGVTDGKRSKKGRPAPPPPPTLTPPSWWLTMAVEDDIKDSPILKELTATRGGTPNPPVIPQAPRSGILWSSP